MNKYHDLLEQVWKISSGDVTTISDILFDADLINDYNLLYQKEQIKNINYINLFSYYMYNNKQSYNTLNIQIILKQNKSFYMYINTILSLCEKWRFSHIYDIVNKSTIHTNLNLKNILYRYNNQLYMFDFKNIFDYIQNKLNTIKYCNQLCLNDIKEYVIRNDELIILESITNYCPIIRHVSNRTFNDIVILNCIDNPFIIGNTIKLNDKKYIFNYCISYQKYYLQIDNVYLCFNTDNKYCYINIISNIPLNDKKFIELKTFEYKNANISSFTNINNKFNKFVYNKHILIGPSNINSYMKEYNSLLYDDMKYNLNVYSTNFNKFIIYYLKKKYNIPNNIKINFDKFTTNILFDYNEYFIKQNKYFICTDLYIKSPNVIEIKLPNWDWK